MTNTRSFVDDFRTIPDMLRHTVAAWPEREAFRQYDYAERRWYSITWRTFHEQVMRWRRAFTHMGLVKGERVAMLLTNCIDAVTFDEAALCGGLVPTPLHAIDTAGSSAYILRDSNARFLVTTSRARWNAIAEAAGEEGLPDMQLVVFTNEQVEPGSVWAAGISSFRASRAGLPPARASPTTSSRPSPAPTTSRASSTPRAPRAAPRA